jgi:putative colanic acid biosynthesis UDP-glucose lipid carrier transferase
MSNEIPLDNPLNSIAKRTFDLVFASLATIFILSWLIPLVGILIKLESRGPVFFIQKRNGVNNNVFNCLKFRSMTPNDYADTNKPPKMIPESPELDHFFGILRWMKCLNFSMC